MIVRFLLLSVLLLLTATIAFAQTATLSWDASPSDVTGYKVYYQSTPYVADQWDGSGATEGSSPIDVGDVLTYQLTNLTDGVIYYFAVTAYDADSNESAISNVVHSNPTGDGVINFGGVGRVTVPGDGHASF